VGYNPHGESELPALLPETVIIDLFKILSIDGETHMKDI